MTLFHGCFDSEVSNASNAARSGRNFRPGFRFIRLTACVTRV
jgi:hypothetical protein